MNAGNPGSAVKERELDVVVAIDELENIIATAGTEITELTNRLLPVSRKAETTDDSEKELKAISGCELSSKIRELKQTVERQIEIIRGQVRRLEI